MAYLEPYLSSSETGIVYLKGVEISQAHKNYLRIPELPSKFTTSDYVGEVDFLGYDNDTFTLSGVFDEKADNKVSKLKILAKTTQSVYIYDPIFFTSGNQKIRIETLKFSRKATDGIYISSSDTIKGSIVYYQIDGWLSE